MTTRIRSTYISALLCASLVQFAAGQGASVTGAVTDATDGQPLPGANVVVLTEGSSALVGGGASDVDGMYVIANLPEGTYTLRATYTGYNEWSMVISLSANEDRTVDIELVQGGFELNTVVVTASRQQEKVLDAPASVSVVDADEMVQEATLSSVSTLRNTTGVDMAQTGVDRREMVLRGFNNAFSGASFVMTDYRQAAVPSLGVNIYSIMPNQSTDIDRTEVVRGPGSALYGAGVDQGVINFVTRDPFTHPGTSLTVSGGQQSSFLVEGRQAGVISRKVGYKLTGFFAQAEDWALDPNDDEDAVQLLNDHTYDDPTDPSIPSNQKVDPSTGKIIRNNDYEKFNLNGSVEYRFNTDTKLIATAGVSRLTATVLTGIGTVQADGFGYSYGQLRLRSGGFFAQTYLNVNEAGDSYVYGTGDKVVDKSRQLNAQAQQQFDLSQGRHSVIVGLDFEFLWPDTEGTIHGRNEDSNSIQEYGGYVQGTFSVTPKLDITAAARGDYNNINEEIQVSPRAAIVFKPTSGHSVRATYNRAFSSPSTNSLFLDIVAREADATLPITVRGMGSANGHQWERNSVYSPIAGTDLVASSLNPAALNAKHPVGLGLDAVYGALYQGLAALSPAELAAILQANGIMIDAPGAAFLQQQLSPENTTVEGFSQGALAKLNLSTLGFDPVPGNELAEIEPLKQTTTQIVELGYKGVVNNKVLIAVDGYWAQKQDFVGPLSMETPLVFVPTLAPDLTAAITSGINDNATLSAVLGQLNIPPEAAAALLVDLANQQGALPDATTPVAVVQPTSNNASPPEMALSYRNFGKITFWGADASVQVVASNRLTVFGNLSVVSQGFFDSKDLEEENESLMLALNAPTFKARVGGKYGVPRGITLSASARFVGSLKKAMPLTDPGTGGKDKCPFLAEEANGFCVLSGPYQGFVKDYWLFDVGVGYDFGNYAAGLRVDLGVQNVFDNQHREFTGAPMLGRMAMIKATYTLPR